MNSSLFDIKPLQNAIINKNVYLYPGTDGSGRDRIKSKQIINDNVSSLAALLRKYRQMEAVIVFTTMAGGTGSGSVKTFVQIIKKVIPNVKVNVVGILPSLKEDELAFKNTIECWNDINSIMGLINDVKFVDNNKRSSYKEINKEVIESLDLAYNIVGIHCDGTIDSEDSLRINTAVGSGLVLKLYDGLQDVKAAIDLAIKNSVFVQPDIYDCDYLAINLKEDGYDPYEVSKEFEVYRSTYITYNNKNNIVVLGGCETPTESISLIKMALDDKNKRKSLRSRKRSIIIELDSEENDEFDILNLDDLIADNM